VNRGDVFDVADIPGGPRPVVIATRDVAIPVLANVTVALVTGQVRELRTEVPLGSAQGLSDGCVVNCDNLFTVPKRVLGRRRGNLGPDEIRRFDEALRIALDLD
jgi:mRNA-degrading endonuclease toxin of MazEF toxin-antitoxin module